MENKMVHCVVLLVHAWQQELVKRWLFLLYFLQQAVFQRNISSCSPQTKQDRPKKSLCSHAAWTTVLITETQRRSVTCRRVPCVDMTHRTLWGNEVAMLGKSPQPHGWLMTSPAAITGEARGQLSGTCPPGDFYPIRCLPSIQPWEKQGPWDPWESSRARLELHLPQESFEQLPSSTGEHQQARPLDGLLWMIITALIQDGNAYSQPQCRQPCCTATKIGLDERDKDLE